MESLTGWQIWLVCPDCGSGDFDNVEELAGNERSTSTRAKCSRCGRRWIVSATLRPET